MRAVVTGGAGFIGAALTTELLRRGNEVVVVDNFVNSSKEDVPDGAELAIADIRNVDNLAEPFAGAEVVYHQAALKSVPRSIEEPVVVHDTNATGTLNVLLAAERAGVRKVVYASSSSVYGGALQGKSHEDMTPRPLSPYGVSKLTAEYYCSVWAGLERVDTINLRYFNVFGPGQKAASKYAAVFPAFISALTEGRPPEIHWDGEQSRDFTFITDVVEANILAAEKPTPPGITINVAGGTPRTINEVFESVSKVLEVDLEPVRVPRRPGDIRHSYADPGLSREILGWSPRTPWDEAVAATVQWFTRDH